MEIRSGVFRSLAKPRASAEPESARPLIELVPARPGAERPRLHRATPELPPRRRQDGRTRATRATGTTGATGSEHRIHLRLDDEVVRLYYAVEALKMEDTPYVLQFVAATPGEGTTSTAWGFAIAASLEYRQSVLVVDCGGTAAPDQPTIIEDVSDRGEIGPAARPVSGVPGLCRASLSRFPSALLHVEGSLVQRIFDELRERYAVVVLDCPAAGTASDSLAMSRHADGTVLVIRSGQARRRAIERVQSDIARFGGALIGAVFNDRRETVPRWLYERL